ncbi:MAG: HDOD domain-containing protein, partial [Bdellovibrionales bacterium]|nr:HDOD domain-containing protein [Bdellovibrionales bacterium]
EPTKDPSSVSELVPDRNNLTHLLALARDPNARTPDLTKAFLQDPVVTLELIRTYQFASGRTAGAPLQDLKDVIVLLGPALIQDLCEQLLERQQFNNPNTVKWLTAARKRCVKAGNIAYKLADTLRGSNPEEARIAAMLKELGDLELICKHPEAYVGHAEQLSRVKLVYQMAKEHGFHPDASAVSFLKRMQCPQNLLELIDPEASPSAAEKTKLRMICRAASEVVELDSQENLEKLSPTKTLSSRSALRVLQIPPNQYAELFEEFTSIIDHVNKQEALAPAPEPSPARDELESTPQQEETSSETEVQHPNHLLDDLNEIVEAELAPSANDKLENVEPLVDEVERPTLIMAPKLQIDKPMPRFNTVAIDSMIANSAAIIATQKDPMDTISSVMESMITQSPFSRAALVLVNFETMEAQVLEGRGIGFENGGVSIIDDSNSSFLSREVQIYSFAKQGKHKTLFGSMTYAMGPVGMNDSQTLLLYADCGPNEVLPFASRRMFRQLLTMLQKHCGGVLDDDNEKFAQQEESQ